MSDTSLFSPLTMGSLQLANRIVMAPLTRNRAPGAVPTPLMVTADSKVKCNTCKPRKVSRCKHHPGTTSNSSPKTV